MQPTPRPSPQLYPQRAALTGVPLGDYIVDTYAREHHHEGKATAGRKLGAEKLTPEEQRRRFIEAAREAGCSEDEAEFDATLAKVAKPKG